MELKSVILEELDREAELTRRALERVPEGRNDWRPHPKSMPMGQLAHMVANIPSWISMIVKQNELDINPQNGGANGQPRNVQSTAELLKALDKGVSEARQAVSQVSDKDLQAPWKLLEGGKVAMQNPKYKFIMENFGHLAHHRGQLTVYLRMNNAQVPAIYGPSADDHRF